MVSVGISRTEVKRCVCGTRGQGQQSILVMRRFLTTASVQGEAEIPNKWTLQQDGTRRLTPPEAINVKMSFIEQNITLWLANNPYLNLVEYTVWGALQQMVYHCKSFKSVQELKSSTVAAWQQLSQAFLDQSIRKWRHRPENIRQCNGEHIEHVC